MVGTGFSHDVSSACVGLNAVVFVVAVVIGGGAGVFLSRFNLKYSGKLRAHRNTHNMSMLRIR